MEFHAKNENNTPGIGLCRFLQLRVNLKLIQKHCICFTDTALPFKTLYNPTLVVCYFLNDHFFSVRARDWYTVQDACECYFIP